MKVSVADAVRAKRAPKIKRKMGALRGKIRILDPDWWKPMSEREAEDFIEGRSEVHVLLHTAALHPSLAWNSSR